jgi:hypothetical protein
VTRPGGMVLIWAFGRSLPWSLIGGGVTGEEMAARFSRDFELERVLPGQWPKGAAWYTFRRREPEASGPEG